MANPAQKAWSEPYAAQACVAALSEHCPWVGGVCEGCSDCVSKAQAAGQLGMCAEGTRLQWCMAAFRGQLNAFHCIDKAQFITN